MVRVCDKFMMKTVSVRKKDSDGDEHTPEGLEARIKKF